jgi:prephenate dehydrogenase
VHPQSLGVAGIGILGCSIALRYREVHAEQPVYGFDLNQEHLAFARERGAITDVAASLPELAARADILVLAVPISHIIAMLELLREIPREHIRARLIIDVASVKSAIVAAGARLPGFVGTHPMAGSERSGPEAARADIFRDRPWVYVPNADRITIEAARAFIEEMGARPIGVDAATHDAIVARSSHLPQTLSTLLAVRALREPIRGIFGQGLLDMLRLAGSTDAVWNDIYFSNADAIGDELKSFADALYAIAAAVKSGDRAYISELFAQANRDRAGLGEPPFVG